MAFEVNDGEGIQALYYNLEVKRENGWAVLEPGTGGCEVTIETGALGTGSDTITIQSGSVLLDGEPTAVAQQTLSVPEGSADPRKDVMVINDDGSIARVSGYPEGKYPDSDPLLEAERPAPSSLKDNRCVPLAILAIPQGATSISSSDVLDIRKRAELDVSDVVADSVTLREAPSNANHAVRKTEFDSHVSDFQNASYIEGINLDDGSTSASTITDVITGDNLTLDTGYEAGTVRIDASGGSGDGSTSSGLYLGFEGEMGTESQTGDGTSLQFTWPHNVSLSGSVSDLVVDVDPASSDASTDFWEADVTSTEIVIEYAAAPANGANLIWNWEVWDTASEGGTVKYVDYDEVVEPSTPSSGWRMYTDSNDGSLKVKNADGSITTLVSN